VWHVSHHPADEALAAAEKAVGARQESPSAALEAARELIARDDISAVARVVALWAAGLAERELNALEDAERHLREAIELGRSIGDDHRVAQVSSALVPVLAVRGRSEEALELADAIDGLHGPAELADLEMKRALVLVQVGRLAESLDAYTRALAIIQTGDDRVMEARVRSNRAVVLTYQGDTQRALVDLEIAERLATEHGQYFLAGGAAHNLGFTAGRRGDIVTALASFERADGLYAEVGHPGRCTGVLAADRCEVMMIAGLHDEARTNAELAVRSLADVDDVNDLAEAQLLLARACLAQGDHDAAHAGALDALGRFRAAGRTGWATMAEYLAVRAARETRTLQDPDVIDRAGDLASRLDALGWTTEAVDVHVSTAEMALATGDNETARDHLRAAARARDRGSPDRRANAWLATAMLRRADGNRAAARRAIGAGLKLLAEHQATLGATDLRVGSTVHSRRLLDLRLGLAIESGRPRDILVSAERVRANALAVPSARPDDDDALTGALTELRRLRAELDDARRSMVDDVDLTSAVRRQETKVRDLARTRRGSMARTESLPVPRLQRRLGPHRSLVEFVEHDGVISAIVVTQQRCRRTLLVRVDEISPLLDIAFFSLERLARDGSPTALGASYDSLLDALVRLDDLLVRPLRLGDGAVVVVPTGSLHRVPWGGLPSLRGRAVVVTASAKRWASAAHRLPADAALATVSGPGLDAVDAEVHAVRAEYATSRHLGGQHATVAATLDLLAGADVAHIACHGHFRADSPMFSSLLLADGPLTVYDLEGLSPPPSTVVLPACHAGRSAVGVGDELIGTTSALLGVGVAAVLAPITIVNDRSTVAVMQALHRRLSAGVEPGEALSHARTEIVGHGDLAATAAALAMLCFE
jgi:CHAT domain-containing protein/tetratricopeptide (TPR) repeat protein